MSPTTGVKAPRALAETRRWAAPGSLGCLSTPMGDAELESLVETLAAVLAAERGG